MNLNIRLKVKATRDLFYFGEYVPFQIAVQILRCNNQHDHHQKAPKHKEKGKDGLTDPEDLEKKWSIILLFSDL